MHPSTSYLDIETLTRNQFAQFIQIQKEDRAF